MNELYYFKLRTCPYCIQAEKWISELISENSEYGEIKIRAIDEQAEKQLADSYDYYYVPTFFLGDKKLHEGAATKEKIKAVFDFCVEAIKVKSVH